jgi:hypothetical protein
MKKQVGESLIYTLIVDHPIFSSELMGVDGDFTGGSLDFCSRTRLHLCYL